PELVPERLVRSVQFMVQRAVRGLGGAGPLALALATACSSSEPEPEAEPNLGECSSAWVPVTGGNRSDSEPPTELLFSGGDLFFFRFQWGPDGSTSSDLVQFDLRTPSRELATAVLVPDVYSAPM